MKLVYNPQEGIFFMATTHSMLLNIYIYICMFMVDENLLWFQKENSSISLLLLFFMLMKGFVWMDGWMDGGAERVENHMDGFN